jgi:hypothetical protein
METGPRDNLRILGAAELLVVVLVFLFTAWMVTRTGQPKGEGVYLPYFLKALLPFLFILTVLGFAALSGKSWGFPLAVVIAVFLFVLAAIQTRLVVLTNTADGIERTLFIPWLLALFHAVISILYRKYLKELKK